MILGVGRLAKDPVLRRRSGSSGGFAGFGLVEVLATVAIGTLIALALTGVVRAALDAQTATRDQNALTRDARFAMQRMVRAVAHGNVLLVPLEEDPATGDIESIRDPGVLATTLDPALDRDEDGFADADNDRDGKVDEDLPRDTSNDGAPGLKDIDDDNDGTTDVSAGGAQDDDETATGNDEDPINGIDDDGDASVDEDPSADMNGDASPGVAGFDDDADGQTDEGSVDDDDEDGAVDEDWYDAVAYFLSGTDLIERMPNLSPVDGSDYTERVIAEYVTSFRVERITQGSGRAVQVDITLGLQSDDATVLLQTRVRVGGAL